MLLYLLAVAIEQPVAVALPSTSAEAAPPHNFLHPPALPCDRSGADEVVVCGARETDSPYRLKPIDDGRYAEAPIKLETKFLGGTLGPGMQQVGVGGFPSNRIMLNWKIKF